MPGGSNCSVTVETSQGNPYPPESGLFLVKLPTGTILFAGYYRSVTETILANNRIFEIQAEDLATTFADCGSNEFPLMKGYKPDGALSLRDHMGNVFTQCGVVDPDKPFNLLSFSTDIEALFQYRADGIFLSQALDELSTLIGGWWRFTPLVTQSEFPQVSPLGHVEILPWDWRGTNAPFDLTIPTDGRRCMPFNQVSNIKVTVTAPTYSKIIILGKNGNLEYLDTIVPVLTEPDEPVAELEAGNLQRIFPLRDGPTRIQNVKVNTVLQTLYYRRADDPENFTDANGDPVDALIDITTDGSPTLVYPVGNEPAALSAATITITYATEYALASSEVPGRANQFGASLGVPYAVHRCRLDRRDDIDLTEDAQTAADNARDVIAQTVTQVEFVTSSGGWKPGQGFFFTDAARGRNRVHQLTREVGTQVKSSAGTSTLLDHAVKSSNAPVVSGESLIAKPYIGSLRKRKALLRIGA